MMKRMKTTILSAMVHFLTLDISHDFVCRNPATTSSQKRSSRIENVEDEDVPSRHSHSLGRRTEGEDEKYNVYCRGQTASYWR